MEKIKTMITNCITKVTALFTTYEEYIIGFCVGVIVTAVFH